MKVVKRCMKCDESGREVDVGDGDRRGKVIIVMIILIITTDINQPI